MRPAARAGLDRAGGRRAAGGRRGGAARRRPPGLAAALSNDLADAACALAPQLTRTLDAGRAAGALGAVVSGSGPTVALLVESATAARDVAAALVPVVGEGRLRTASGPAVGARVLEAVA